jgi:plasmid stability protein
MRTTLNIEDNLLQSLKVAAADTGHSLSELAEEAIRAYLSPRQGSKSKPIVLPVAKHDLGLRPGVNLDSNAAIAEAMDEEFMEKMRAATRR